MSNTFIHLKAHSEYSVVDGILRIKDFVGRAAAYKMPAVAMTDVGNLFGLVKFYRQAIKQGVKPIIGADVCLKENDEIFHITLLCQNKAGYLNLTRLLSRGYVEGQYEAGKPSVQREWLEAAAEGLIVLSGGRAGDVGQAILKGHEDQAIDLIKRWQQAFPNNYYLELTRTHRDQEEDYLHAAVKLAGQCQVPVVATNDVRFLEQDDFEAHEARVCIHSGYVLEDSTRPRAYSEWQYFRSSKEMCELFADIPEAIENTVLIAKRCNADLHLGTPFLPQFPTPPGVSLEQYIKQQAELGLAKRLQRSKITDADKKQAYDARLQLELGVINRMGFRGYFLIVADFIRWAKEQSIPVGPGRGSGAGSLVAYSLGITELDPLEHELLFERFLNPERVSMPDFDIDFCMEKRDRVIDYVAERYGREAVSQIITFGTMAAKAVVRDVGRVLGYPYGFVDKIAKLVPFELGITLSKALAQEEALRSRYQEEEDVTTLIDLALKLEGVTRNAGKHAGGVVIAPTKLTDFAPLYCEPGGTNLVTQFDKDDVEAVGLVKFDFLGLRTLTIIDWALQTINRKRALNNQAPIDIDTIPLNDPKPFQILQNCATTAVFQLESRGMKELIRRLRPDCFEEITALVALFRPGPLQSGMVDDFIDRKHGRAPVNYPHPDLEQILKPTYGVILYQEQVMQIAQVLANYSLGGADILRRAMGKKKPEEMAKQRTIFTEGAVGRGIESSVATYIFDLMEKFAGYGFNKSHSAAYALIAYQTAWLKAHYPAEFMAAVLSSDMDNTDKVVGFLEECSSMQLTVNPPSVNVGRHMFTVNSEDAIEYGLGAIKGAGEAAIVHIAQEREANGPYRDLFDFCRRLGSRKVGRRVLEPLITSGAMDCFNIDRGILVATINNALKAAEQFHYNQTVGQGDLFGIAQETPTDEQYATTSVLNRQEQLYAEKAVLGHYLSGHPLESYVQLFARINATPIKSLCSGTKNKLIAGLLMSVRTIITKSGRRMAIALIEDRTARIEVTLFSRLYDTCAQDLEVDKIYVIKGNVEDDDYTGGVRMVAESIEPFADRQAKMIKRLVIQVDDKPQVENILTHLPGVIEQHRGGHCAIAIRYQSHNAQAELVLGQEWRVYPNDECVLKIKELCGTEKVMVDV